MTTATTATTTNNHIPRTVPGAWDSPPTRAGARARVTTTREPVVARLAAAAKTAGRQWWVWTSRPPSLRAVWRLSATNRKRVPGNSGFLFTLWRISNATDRLALFALLLVAPTAIAGPLRWITVRPTRRWAVYFVVGVTLVAFRITSEGSR